MYTAKHAWCCKLYYTWVYMIIDNFWNGKCVNIKILIIITQIRHWQIYHNINIKQQQQQKNNDTISSSSRRKKHREQFSWTKTNIKFFGSKLFWRVCLCWVFCSFHLDSHTHIFILFQFFSSSYKAAASFLFTFLQSFVYDCLSHNTLCVCALCTMYI